MYDATAHRLDLHRRARSLIARYLRRYWYRAVQGAGGLGDLFVTLEEVDAELEVGALAPPAQLPSLETLEAQVAAARAEECTRRTQAPDLPARRLQLDAELHEDVLEALLVMTALQSSPGLLRTCTFAWADFSLKQPTAAFIIELLADDMAHRQRLERALAPDETLRRLRLLMLGDDRRWQPATPMLQRPCFVPDAVHRFIGGGLPIGEDYPAGAIGHEDAGPSPDQLVLHDPQRLAHLLRRLARREDSTPVMLVGAPGAGRRAVARAHALANERNLFTVSVGAMAWELEPFENQLTAALRDGLLARAVVLLRCECFNDRADRRPSVLARIVRTMRVPTVVTAGEGNLPQIAPAFPEAHVVMMGDAPFETRRLLYDKLLHQHRFELPDAALNPLVDTYTLRPGDMDRALRDVRLTTGDALTTKLDMPAFDIAVRRQIRTNLASLATPISTTQRWDDLVLEEEQREVIMEILDHARLRTRVFEDWGFSRKIGARGRGLSCLFSGPPGTGKTMSASLIAKELGLDLYQVDLASIVDKYVGETEKNLGRLFDEASRVPVVLLFDEADSLFATRTKVESSNDRYANLEVNYLLQRMEQYEGISILTTNLGTGIDQAFKRRLRFRLHFELPGPDQRETLWKSMVPPGIEIDGDIDWRFLARKWEMSGALIRNAMVRAAFLAAARDEPMTNELIRKAARAELMEMGRLGS